jgi:hypothetical protein
MAKRSIYEGAIIKHNFSLGVKKLGILDIYQNTVICQVKLRRLFEKFKVTRYPALRA